MKVEALSGFTSRRCSRAGSCARCPRRARRSRSRSPAAIRAAGRRARPRGSRNPSEPGRFRSSASRTRRFAARAAQRSVRALSPRHLRRLARCRDALHPRREAEVASRLPLADSTQSRPPWRSTALRAIASPIPVPGYLSLEWRRRNGRKISFARSGSTPIPSSRTPITQVPSGPRLGGEVDARRTCPARRTSARWTGGSGTAPRAASDLPSRPAADRA